jgi:superfamily II DNA or RNA helicase
MTEINLRPWQAKAKNKCLNWFEKNNKRFVINAAPGAGKTICASVISRELISKNVIDKVIVIAPRTEVVRQWAQEFEFVTGRIMYKVTGADNDLVDFDHDLCATWASIQNLKDEFQKVCASSNTLIICDEHHHAAVEASWGEGANSSFITSKYTIILTGTPIRSDGQDTIWLTVDQNGKFNHPQEGTYTLSYGKAVDLGYCRPVTFHRHEGNFSVSLEGEKITSIDSSSKSEIKNDFKKIRGLQKALDFYKLVCTRQYLEDGITPDENSFQGSMIKWGINKLNQTRLEMPNAGGLIIAPNIETADFMCNLIELIEGEKPTLVHSQVTNPEQRINTFRKTNKKWLVSVAMVSEGVDIKRLRVLIYLPSAQTELFFRQAIGRVVRSNGEDDYTRAYVIMPSLPQFEKFALSVEKEMSPKFKNLSNNKPLHKVCPTCENKCKINDKECSSCGHEFTQEKNQQVLCLNCGEFNEADADYCFSCNAKLSHDFKIELNEALRDGAIIRGMELDEDEVQAGEKMGHSLKNDILASGDHVLIKLLNVVPEESFGRLAKMVNSNST